MNLQLTEILQKSELGLVIPVQVTNIKDLLKLSLTSKMAGCYTPNEAIYCKVMENGKSKEQSDSKQYVYFVFVRISDVLTLRGLLFEYYVVTDEAPLDFLWWNPKTGSIKPHKSPKPDSFNPDRENPKDPVEVFSVIRIKKMPHWFYVWNNNKGQ